jgi:glycosyltransferase involved in cell wall biosynthesis/GT2 family glycosyltransferase
MSVTQSSQSRNEFEDQQARHNSLLSAIAPYIPPGVQESDLTRIAGAIAANDMTGGRQGRQILIDVSAIVKLDAKTGIQRVTRSILKEFLIHPPADCRVEPVFASPTSQGYRYARHYRASILGQDESRSNDEIQWHPGDIFLGMDLQHKTLINQRAFLLQLRRDGVRVLCVVYDLLPILQPQFFALEPDLHTRWLETVTEFDGALCISRAVADELMVWLEAHGRPRLRPFEVSWFHLGADIENSVPSAGIPSQAATVFERLGKAPGFLMVGTVEPRKGHQQTLTAFEQLWQQGVDATLVIVGKQGWKVESLVTRLRRHPEAGKRLFWLSGISDEFLEKLYGAATCLIAASEGEGFGLPLIEAARRGLPIIARDLPVFREVAGSHAFYFEGLDADCLAAAVQQWLTLKAAGTAPPSSGMPWLTWVASTAQLKDRIFNNTWYQQWTVGDPACMPEPLPAKSGAVNELAAIKASTSWRLTAPLRAISRLAHSLMEARRQEQPPSPIAVSRDAAPVVLKPRYPLRDAWYDSEQPEVSLIVLNLNKPNMTLACLDSLWEHSEGYRYEIILVDNGSEPIKFRQLEPAAAGARLLRLEVNRFFGEGNNLGFEASRGRYVIFLNNDITANPGWLAPLIRRLAADPGIGAAGPMLISPDYRLQEAGGEIRLDGTDNRYGRDGDPDDPEYGTPRDVMYVSAAAIAMRRETFAQALGFDLCFEPAYYEDCDLCLKIKQMGLRVIYCPESRITHHENATTLELDAQLRLNSLIPLNRERFLTRWRPVLAGDTPTVPGLIPPPAGPSQHREGAPSILLYTPHNLVPGGGERYLLTIAAGLADIANVTLATEHPFSRLRLLTMGRELSLNLNDVRIMPLAQALESAAYDRAIVMGNEVLPSIPGPARQNIFLCQFPFPASAAILKERARNGDSYEQVVVYSPFVKHHYQEAIRQTGRDVPKITVISPPAVLAPIRSPDAVKKPMVLGVGRFFTGDHAKRHDLMIEAFRELHLLRPEAELHLAGSLNAEAAFRAYFLELQERAEGLPVFFHPNASPEQLTRLYADASLYWHLAGYGVDETIEPQCCEHFGITVVEAMSAGCIPLIVNRGGPPKTVRDGVTGYVFESLEELVERSASILALPPDDAGITAMRAAAITDAGRYNEEDFVATFRALLGLSAEK